MAYAKRKSKRLIKRLDKALRYSNRAENLFYCNQIEKDGFKYTEENRLKMLEASGKFEDARNEVKNIFAEMIGKEIVTEIAAGEWKNG